MFDKDTWMDAALWLLIVIVTIMCAFAPWIATL